LAAILGGIAVLPFEAPADVTYSEVRTQLEQTGNPIGANDMLIAAQALSLGLTLVTANQREFSRVQGLTIENWLH
jgi:tRNA(fMet)-specific endonuclease VapC